MSVAEERLILARWIRYEYGPGRERGTTVCSLRRARREHEKEFSDCKRSTPSGS
jgi:hypothetical protein